MILYPSPSSCHLICHLAGRRWVWMSKSKMIQKTCPCAACSTGACPLRFSLRGENILLIPGGFASGLGTLEFRSQSRRNPVLCPNQPVHTFSPWQNAKKFSGGFSLVLLREMHRLTHNLRDTEFHSRSLTPNAAFWMRCVEFSSAMMRHKCVFGMASEVAV